MVYSFHLSSFLPILWFWFAISWKESTCLGSSYLIIFLSFFLSFFVFVFVFVFSRVAPTAYGGSQARGLIGSGPQQRRIWATSATYTTAHCNTRSLSHWAKPGIKPATSWFLVGFTNCWATTGTPFFPLLETIFFYYSKKKKKKETILPFSMVGYVWLNVCEFLLHRSYQITCYRNIAWSFSEW